MPTGGCHYHSGQNLSQELSIKKPASQRTSSVGEGQQPMLHVKTTIDTYVVDGVLRISLRRDHVCAVVGIVLVKVT